MNRPRLQPLKRGKCTAIAAALSTLCWNQWAFVAKAATSSTAEPQATAAARVEQKQKQIRQIRPDNYDLKQHPITDAQAKHWKNILWTTALVQPQDPFVSQSIGSILALSGRNGLSDGQARTVDMAFQIGTQLYLDQPDRYAAIGQQFQQTLDRSADPQWVAMALSALAKSAAQPAQVQQWRDHVRQRFPGWSQNPVLSTTLADIDQQLASAPVPPLADLLNWTVAPGEMQLYVFCPRDRNLLCLTVLKDRQGKFVREANTGTLWSVPLLLRSIHRLGWNFTRGQTPQGLYRIEGLVPQPDNLFFRAYGQFSLVNLFVPFEAGVKAFLPGRPGPFKGSLQAYQALWPTTWRNYNPISQSYWAGRLGRGLFRIHGSGEAPDFFSKSPAEAVAMDWNPTLGCLSALELYDQTGRLQQADMPKILHALSVASGNTVSGYLAVVELPTTPNQPLSLDAIETALR